MGRLASAFPEAHRGHVLWIVLLLLGVLAELALGSLQLAAASGLRARAEDRRLMREARAEAIAATLERLPIASISDVPLEPLTPWHPHTSADKVLTGCADGAASYLLSGCHVMAPAWQWRLQRLPDDPSAIEGTDFAAFPALQPQSWQLDVVVSSPDRHRNRWRYNYRQQAGP